MRDAHVTREDCHMPPYLEVNSLKALIVFFSYSGTTKGLAEDIALLTDGDLRELVPAKPYSFSYNTAVKEVREDIEKGVCPPLLHGGESVEGYDVVFVGSPNWLKTYAPPVRTFLRTVDLKGKTLVPFCTHGGGGLGTMVEDCGKDSPGASIRAGLALMAEYRFEDVENWLKAFLDGTA